MRPTRTGAVRSRSSRRGSSSRGSSVRSSRSSSRSRSRRGCLPSRWPAGAAGASYYASLRYLRANGRAPEPLLKRVGVTGAAKAAWGSASSRKRRVAGRRSGARSATAGGRDTDARHARPDTAPVAVTPPVVPLGGKPQRRRCRPRGRPSFRSSHPLGSCGSVRGRCGRARGRARRSRPGVGSSVGRVPQPSEAVRPGALDDTVDEGRAALHLLARQREAEQAAHEAVGRIALDPSPAQRLGEHPVGRRGPWRRRCPSRGR